MASIEHEVVNALADVVVSQTSVIPSTTLTAPSIVGATAITVADASIMAQRGYLQWFDNSGEKFAPIANITGSMLTLDYSGYTAAGLTPGLRFPHSAGARVATNLLLHRPILLAPMLRSGLPVLAIWPRRKDTGELTTRSTLSPIVVRVQIHLPINIAESDPIDPEVWNEAQQERCQDLLQQIENALTTDNGRRLNASLNLPGPHALGMGIDGKRWATTVWDVITENIDIPQAVAAMDVTIRPKRHVY